MINFLNSTLQNLERGVDPVTAEVPGEEVKEKTETRVPKGTILQMIK